MKKLLLAAAILVLSATAMASNETATDTLAVTATYVTPITVTLSTDTGIFSSSIDFADVYTGGTSAVQTVTANIAGGTGMTYDYTILSSDALVLVSNAGDSSTLAGGTDTFTFDVSINTVAVTGIADDITDANITVNVLYTGIGAITTAL